MINGIVISREDVKSDFCSQTMLFLQDFADALTISLDEVIVYTICVVLPALMAGFAILALLNRRYPNSKKLLVVTWLLIALAICLPVFALFWAALNRILISLSPVG